MKIGIDAVRQMSCVPLVSDVVDHSQSPWNMQTNGFMHLYRRNTRKPTNQVVGFQLRAKRSGRPTCRLLEHTERRLREPASFDFIGSEISQKQVPSLFGVALQ